MDENKKKLTEEQLLEEVTTSEYKYGFTTKVESDTIEKGLSEEVIKTISKKSLLGCLNID